MNNQKGFAGIVLIVSIVVLLGGAVGYFAFFRSPPTLSPTQGPIEKTSPNSTKQTAPQPTQSTGKSENEPAGWLKYIDPQNRFSFLYPPTFGSPSQGTNSGFGDRVSAIRFSEFSSGVHAGKIVLGGEVVLTKGFVLVDVQALGGLYDSISLEVFPDTMRNNIISNLPTLTATNFCSELAKAQHVDLNKSVFTSLNQQQKDAIIIIDRTRNVDPKVIRCDLSGDTVTFHKEATFEAGQAKSRQNIYGAIRFIKSPFSSFQMVRVSTEVPSQGMLSDITLVANSFK